MSHVAYLIQEIAPAEEPISLVEAKLYLRVDQADEESVIAQMIVTARRKAEHYMRRSLISQSWKIAYDEYVPASIELPRGPIQSVTSVKTISRDAVENTLIASSYYLSAGGCHLHFDASPMGHRIEIIYAAGYGAAADVPVQIKQGLLSHIARMFDERDGALEIEGTVRCLYDDYRIVRL